MSRETQAGTSNTSRLNRTEHDGLMAWQWSAVLALVAVLAGAAVIFDAPSPLRPLAVLVFLGFGPGLSLIGLFGISDLTQCLVLGVGLSLALDTIVAGLSLYAGVWSPLGVLMTLVAITLVGITLQMWSVTRAPGSVTVSTTGGARPRWMNVNATPQAAVMAASGVNIAPATSTTGLATNVSAPAGTRAIEIDSRGKKGGSSPRPSPQFARIALLAGFIGGSIMLIALSTRRAFHA